jgi:hypothetical protein
MCARLCFFQVQSAQRAPYQKVSRPRVSFQIRSLYMPGGKRVTSPSTDKARARASRPKKLPGHYYAVTFGSGEKSVGQTI